MLVSVSNPKIENGALVGLQHIAQGIDTNAGEFYKLCEYPKFCQSVIEWAQSRDIIRFAVWLNIHDKVTTLYGFSDIDTESVSLLWQYVHSEQSSKLEPTAEPLLEEALRHLRCGAAMTTLNDLQSSCHGTDLTLQQFLSVLQSELSVNDALEPAVELQIALGSDDFRTARRVLYQYPKLARKISWKQLMANNTDLLQKIYKVCVELQRMPSITSLRKLAFSLQVFDMLDIFREETPRSSTVVETSVLRAERWFQTLRLWDACLQNDAKAVLAACQHGAYTQAERALAYRVALQMKSQAVLEVLQTFLTEYERTTAEQLTEDAIREAEEQVFQALT